MSVIGSFTPRWGKGVDNYGGIGAQSGGSTETIYVSLKTNVLLLSLSTTITKLSTR